MNVFAFLLLYINNIKVYDMCLSIQYLLFWKFRVSSFTQYENDILLRNYKQKLKKEKKKNNKGKKENQGIQINERLRRKS